MQAYAIIDTTKRPIVQVTFTGEKSTDDNFDQYLQELERIYDDKKTLSIIFDASNASIPNLSHQKKQASWIGQNWDMIEKYCTATAYVIPNLVVRSVLKMIFSFQHQPAPYKVFSNYREAHKWLTTEQAKEN